MDLQPYVETVHHHLLVAAEAGGDEARAVAERLTATVDSTVRLAVQDALVAAAEEITCELAPGSVELRLRGRDAEFVVRPRAGCGERSSRGRPGGPDAAEDQAVPAAHAERTETSEGGTARVNLRLPDHLKARAEQAAATERASLNAWLVKAVTAAVDRAGPPRPQVNAALSGRQRYVGWAR